MTLIRGFGSLQFLTLRFATLHYEGKSDLCQVAHAVIFILSFVDEDKIIIGPDNPVKTKLTSTFSPSVTIWCLSIPAASGQAGIWSLPAIHSCRLKVWASCGGITGFSGRRGKVCASLSHTSFVFVPQPTTKLRMHEGSVRCYRAQNSGRVHYFSFSLTLSLSLHGPWKSVSWAERK